MNDTDDDGLDDNAELHTYFTNPASNDTDDDGLWDADELNIHLTSPISNDTDNDGLNDSHEIAIGTNPRLADSDGDGLDDLFEILNGINPILNDTDNDGYLDGVEIAAGTNPLSASDYPGIPTQISNDLTNLMVLIILMAAVGVSIFLNVMLFLKTRKIEQQTSKVKENTSKFNSTKKNKSTDDPVTIIKMKYAKDEITEEEFLKKKKLLQS